MILLVCKKLTLTLTLLFRIFARLTCTGVSLRYYHYFLNKIKYHFVWYLIYLLIYSVEWNKKTFVNYWICNNRNWKLNQIDKMDMDMTSAWNSYHLTQFRDAISMWFYCQFDTVHWFIIIFLILKICLFKLASFSQQTF